VRERSPCLVLLQTLVLSCAACSSEPEARSNHRETHVPENLPIRPQLPTEKEAGLQDLGGQEGDLSPDRSGKWGGWHDPEPFDPTTVQCEGKSVAYWLHLLQHGNANDRRTAAGALLWASHGLEGPTLSSSDPMDRETAESEIRSAKLGRLSNKAKAFVPPLARALDDDDPQVRGAAASALGAIGPEAVTALPSLERHLEDANEMVEIFVARSVYRISFEVPAALETNVLLLSSKDPEVRFQAVINICSMGTDGAPARPNLTALANDPSSDVRSIARRTVECLDRLSGTGSSRSK